MCRLLRGDVQRPHQKGDNAEPVSRRRILQHGYEAKCADKITPEIKKAVEDKIAEFQATPDLLANWSEVDYSKL